MNFIHYPSVVRAILTSLMILIVSIYSGPIVFQTATPDNPEREKNILSMLLEQNSEYLISDRTYLSRISAVNNNSLGFTPIYPFNQDIEEIWLSKNISATSQEEIPINDSRFNTDTWRLFTSGITSQQVLFNDSDIGYANILLTALIKDISPILRFQNRTSDPLTSEDEIRRGSTNEYYWNILLLFSSDVLLEIVIYGSDIIFFQYRIDNVFIGNNGLLGHINAQTLQVYTGVFPDTVLDGYKSTINQVIDILILP